MMPQEMPLDDDWQPSEEPARVDLSEIVVTPPRKARGPSKRSTLGRVCAVLRAAPEFATLRLNEMSGAPELDGEPLPEARRGAIRESLETHHGFPPAAEHTSTALLVVANEHPYHPVREYLRGLRWDGVERLDRVARDYLGAAPAPINTTCVRAWFVSAVARAMEPGCKVDTCLVLVGAQGAGKSQVFSILGGAWFSDTAVDVESKDAMQQVGGAWVYELGELDHITSKAHAGRLKNFMTSAVDCYRRPYHQDAAPWPRHGVMVGTTNEPQFLTDATGDRRFWCVRVGSIDLDALRRDRDQLWAEAVATFDAGEKWWLTREAEAARHAAAEEFRDVDVWEPAIAAWLDDPGNTAPAAGPLTSERILRCAVGMDRDRQDQRAKNRANTVLRRLGWENRPTRVGARTERVWRPVTTSHSDGADL